MKTTPCEAPPTPETATRVAPATEADDRVGRGLRAILDGRWGGVRHRVREQLNDPGLLPDPGLPVDEQRARLLEQVKQMATTGFQNTAFSAINGGEGDNGRLITTLETVGGVNLQLMVKSGLQWGLWGGAIDALGTERHREYIEGCKDLSLLGGYAMTERGHGSNVRDLETTARYFPETDEFEIHSPTAASEKVFLGNVAQHASMAAVFAQLYTPDSDKSHGVHCFIVPIRDSQGEPFEGVRIADNGLKGGLNGVDNGALMFDHVRVPRQNLLNRFGDVDAHGTYTSSIESDNRRFFTMLGTLIRGRIAVGAAAGAAARSALAIAVTYATRRRQFAALPGPETPLIGYRVHRRRLLPHVARAYALGLLQNQLTEEADVRLRDTTSTVRTEEEMWQQREFEAQAAAVKIASTAHAVEAIQAAREACGGSGYMAENLLTTFRADADVFVTFEGDNTVLAQLVGKEMLHEYTRVLKGLKGVEAARFGAQTIGDLLRRRTGIRRRFFRPAIGRRASSLRGADYQLSLVAQREQSMLRSLGRRLHAAKRLNPEDAAALVDRCQDHLVDCAWARIDRLALEALLEAEAGLAEHAEDDALTKVFVQMRQLFALDTIVRHSGWYQEKGLLTGARAAAARAAVNELVDSLGPWAGQLVAGFGVPEAVLAVPMLTTRAGVDGVGDPARG